MHDQQKKYESAISELVAAAVRLGELGYVSSHGGNLSSRVDAETVLITPTKVAKRALTFDDIVIIGMDGTTRYAGNSRKPTGETPIHLNILRQRPDIKGLVHAHPPVLTGFSLIAEPLLSAPLLPEPIIELGPLLYVPYAEPLSAELAAAFDSVIRRSNAFIMRNHGVMICSPDGPWRALELLEMVEAMAQSLFVAKSLGTVTRITDREVDKLSRTIQTRGLPMPGAPGVISKLSDAYPH